MVRLAILLVLLGLTVWEWFAGARKYAYWAALTGLFVFFSLRYGQGTDYITYMGIYANVPALHTFPNFFAFQYNKIEIGFFYLISLCKMLRMHYAVFIALITLVSLLCLNRFIRRFCPLPMFALTIFYAVYSLTYMESAIRQLLPLSIALGWVLPNWVDKRRWRAIAGIVVATLLHTSAAVLFALPILFWQDRPLFVIEWKARATVLLGLLVVAASAVITLVDLTPIIRLLPSQLEYTVYTYYVENNHVSLLALANRGLFMAIVFLLALRARARMTPQEKLLFNLYCVGFALYVVTMAFDLIASRINVYFRILDCCLLPVLFYRNRDLIRRTRVALPALLILLSFLYVKDISAIMDYSEYYSSNPLEYPYITLFNESALLDAKYVNVKNASAMNAYETGGFSWNEYYDQLMRKPTVRSPIVPY